MSTNFPSSLDSYTTHNTGDVIQASDVNNPQDAIVALETKVGVDSSAVTTTLDYKLKNAASINPGHLHTVAAGLNDVNAPSPATNDLFQFNGSKWVNTPAATTAIKFGGTGADGALNITSGTTTINCANAAVVVKNYTSISITGSGTLAFSNPNATGTMIILKSQGNVTLTSSSAPMIDCRNMGSAGGSGGDGSDGKYFLGTTNHGVHSANGNGGAGGAAVGTQYNNSMFYKFYPWIIGAGGGEGDNGSTGNGANGGNGGGALFLECGGAFNFTTTGGISTSGTAGSNGGGGNAGGGGGGGAGSCIILYNTLTANSGTVTTAGGSGGTKTGTAGGGGGGGSYSAGSAGQSSGAGGAGGTGGAAYSLVTQNTDFA